MCFKASAVAGTCSSVPGSTGGLLTRTRAHTDHPGYMPGARGNWSTLYDDTVHGFGWNAGRWAGLWSALVTVTPKSGTVTGKLVACWLGPAEVQFQMPASGGPASGNNWTIAGNRWSLTHPYNAGTVKRQSTPG